uniref:Retrovirus-related Pol polyprotein from transposon TNT 1-94-like beta-barrel domain-containing protein n=1 Tax=Oryza glaberrima TaxID=4538 RepID=A0A679BA18_ORYGL|nr:hypothetical protein [Oryza glaberrima]BBF89489.1 hypothetical protein [Oryza glaberrima]
MTSLKRGKQLCANLNGTFGQLPNLKVCWELVFLPNDRSSVHLSQGGYDHVHSNQVQPLLPVHPVVYGLPATQKIYSVDHPFQKPMMEHRKDMGANSTATDALIDEIHGKSDILKDTKDMEPINIKGILSSAYTGIREHIKGNGGIMGHIKDNPSLMEYNYTYINGIIGMVTINPPYSLGDISSLSLVNSDGRILLDTGAGVHVVGDYRMLKNIRLFYGASRCVTLADRSPLPVVGVGTLELPGFSIPDVYLVAGLRTNLISVSQLDRRHGLCCFFFNEQCRVINFHHRDIGGAILEDGLYVLKFLEVL